MVVETLSNGLLESILPPGIRHRLRGMAGNVVPFFGS
jgi:hypothetical protein